MWKLFKTSLTRNKPEGSSSDQLNLEVMFKQVADCDLDSNLFPEIAKIAAKEIYPEFKEMLLNTKGTDILLNEIRRELVARFLSERSE